MGRRAVSVPPSHRARAALRDGGGARIPLPLVQPLERPDRHLLEAEHVGLVSRRELDHVAEVEPPPRRRVAAVEDVPAPDEHGHGRHYCRRRAGPRSPIPPRSRRRTTTRSRRARARGRDVELLTSRFRFGGSPQPDGYRRRELFYPLSSRLFRRSRLRLPLKAPSIRSAWPAWPRSRGRRPPAMARVPEVDAWLLRERALVLHRPRPAAATLGREPASGAASSPLRPRRRAQRARTRDAGRARRRGGADPRDPAPRLPERSPRADDGRTVLALGVDPAVQGARRRDRGGARIDARCSSPAIRELAFAAARRRSSGGSATSRTPSSTARSARRPSPSSPIGRARPERGAPAARSALACPRSSTTSAASPSPCGRSGPAGRSRRTTSTALAAALAELARRPCGARGGAGRRPARARASSPGTASARAHLALYGELV